MASWKANALKLPFVGLRLNASKLESLLTAQRLSSLPLVSATLYNFQWALCTQPSAGGGWLVQPVDMINPLQTTFLNPRIARAESGSTATIYWGAYCVFDLLSPTLLGFGWNTGLLSCAAHASVMINWWWRVLQGTCIRDAQLVMKGVARHMHPWCIKWWWRVLQGTCIRDASTGDGGCCKLWHAVQIACARIRMPCHFRLRIKVLSSGWHVVWPPGVLFGELLCHVVWPAGVLFGELRCPFTDLELCSSGDVGCCKMSHAVRTACVCKCKSWHACEWLKRWRQCGTTCDARSVT